jgi:outer membrane protein OmpA-like peptidoglycan-associated protein
VTKHRDSGKVGFVMVRTSFNKKCLLGLLAAMLVVACGATPPPRDLVNARSAYQRAENGPAPELAPAQLDTAKQALRAAEESFREEGDTEETKDLAYIAQRRSAQAEAAAGIEQANREKKAADKEYKSVQGQLTDVARAELEATRKRLQEQRMALSEKEKEAEAAKALAETERQARLDVEKKLSAALASLDKIASIKEEKRGVVITLSGSVLFATGKWELLPIAQQRLDEVAKALKDQGYQKIIVEGHTDSRGGRQMNMDLSRKRAESVRSYLISRGIEADKTTSVGIGPDRPVADNKTSEGRANNRRVELVVTPL